ncbi:MAG: Gfo/Idh/MocA family oxidoreductase [Planctomycetales bacterium]|nr:Gfo/Idh/MocA family oxidoreductase [Planctomycetales bacterium]
MATYRVGIIGHTGRGNYGHDLDNVWLRIPGVDIVGVADADPTGLSKAVQRLGVTNGFADYREMLDRMQPDIVSVAPRWLDQHAAMITACADRGIHVFTEKPFCRSPAEADAIVQSCERHQVKLAIAFQTRYSPKLAIVRQLLEQGKIGDLIEIQARGKEDRRGGGEDLWVLGSHVLNLMNHFGGTPHWCHAEVRQSGRAMQIADVAEGNEGLGPLAGDIVHATFGLDNGIVGSFNSHRHAGAGSESRFGIRLLGSKGQIEMKTGLLPNAYLLADPFWSPGKSGIAWQPISSAGLGVEETRQDGGLIAGNVLACLDLLDAIEQDRHPEANMYEARTTVEMIAAVFHSHLSGNRVALPLTNRAWPLQQTT